MRLFVKATILVFALSLFSNATAQNPEPKVEMGHFFMVFLVKGPKWVPEDTPEIKQMKQAHLGHLLGLEKDGRLALAGPASGDGPILGVGVFTMNSIDEVRAFINDDALVKSGFSSAEIHPWFAGKGIMKMPDGPPVKMDKYYLGLLKKGPNWSSGEKAEKQQLQDAHMANISRLASLGKLVIAGPMEDNGDLRGIFVFKTASMDEAKELAPSDPTIKTGHLVLELYTWMVPSGGLP